MNSMLKQALVAGAVFVAVAACSKKEATPSVSDTARPSDSAAMTPATPAPAPAAATTGMINPATASQAEIAALGVADSLAGAIVAARPADMVAVDKILAKSYNEAKRDSIYARLWIPIDLNKASKEEILLIPGVGNKMLREFQEYRPYTSMDQFRREIGKYVDKTELARLEQYVAIK